MKERIAKKLTSARFLMAIIFILGVEINSVLEKGKEVS